MSKKLGMSKKLEHKRAPKRTPMAFDMDVEADIEPKQTQTKAKPQKAKTSGRTETAHPRKAQAISVSQVTETEHDYFDLSEEEDECGTTHATKPLAWALIFYEYQRITHHSFALWTDQLIRDLFARADWLGWVALAVWPYWPLPYSSIEISAIWGQASIRQLQDDLLSAHDLNNDRDAKKAIQRLQKHTKPLANYATSAYSCDRK